MHFLEEIYREVPTGIKRYCAANDITSLEQVPRCKKCGNHVGYNKAYSNRGFVLYCGPTCSRSDKTVPKEVEALLADYDWLYEQRITLRKSKETIAADLSVSTEPVNKWIKFHKLPEVRYNESEAAVKRVLHDKDALDDLYTGQVLRVSEIAELLGTSSATVSRFMQKHGIVARNSNFYERTKILRSKAEIALCAFLDTHNIEYIKNTTTVITDELDIYIPSLKLAFEYNGVYYHTEVFKAKDLHSRKTAKCRELGIKLVHIWEDTWESNRELVMSMITHQLKYSPIRLYARKCEVREISTDVAKLFLVANHVQGYSSASVRLGLYHCDVLVAVATFSKPRFNKKFEWELIRFAVNKHTSISGGFSKLLKYFVGHHGTSIITYADLSYSYGELYEKNGFVLDHVNQPSYWYIVSSGGMLRRVSRTAFTKSRLKDFDQSLSEVEIVKILGIDRIWNCGTLAFKYVQSK